MAQQPKPGLFAGPEQVVIAFKFQVNGVTDPDNVVGGAGVVTDIVEAAGVYTITLAPEYGFTTMVSCVAGVEDSTLEDADYTSWTVATRALVVTTYTKATDLAAQVVGPPTDDKWVHVQAVMCRRSNMAPTESI
jgi:hypothetical protein